MRQAISLKDQLEKIDSQFKSPQRSRAKSVLS